jgi:hypothetical protein
MTNREVLTVMAIAAGVSLVVVLLMFVLLIHIGAL